jgi:hypothetical protein
MKAMGTMGREEERETLIAPLVAPPDRPATLIGKRAFEPSADAGVSYEVPFQFIVHALALSLPAASTTVKRKVCCAISA